MTLRYYANAPATTLAVALTNSATTMTVAAVTGFPINFPYTLILDRGQASEEVVEVTNGTGTVLTITRAADSTTAFAHSIGAVVEHGISARDLREPNQHVNASSGVHGLAGAVVGDTDTQTLTGKTISADSNTISGIAASSFVLSNASGNVDGAAAQKVIPAGAVVGTTDTQTLTNKTVDLASNTLTGTLAQLNTAVSDTDVAGIDATQTLTNKTISADSNTLSGIAASSFVLSNASGNIDGSAAQKVIPSGAVVGTSDTQTLTGKTLTSPTINGTPDMKVKVQSGSFGISFSAQSSVATALTFPQAFASTPIIVAMCSGSSQFYCSSSSVTASGCTITAVQRDNASVTTSCTVFWIAVMP